MRPCTVFCDDSNEVNAKSGQTSRLKVYLKICYDSMRHILTNIQTAIIFLQIKYGLELLTKLYACTGHNTARFATIQTL